MKLVWIASAALALTGACASSPAPGMAAAEQEKKICKTETVLGRYVPVNVCQTQAEWDELAERQARGVKDADRTTRSKSNLNNRITDRPL